MWLGGKKLGILLHSLCCWAFMVSAGLALGANIVGAHMCKNVSGGPRILVTSGSVVHQIECFSVIMAGSTIRSERS